MTIAERKAREADEQRNPWQQIATAKVDGSICEMRMSDMTGLVDFGRARFFLHDDSSWYRISPPGRMSPFDRLTEFRPTGVFLSEDRRRAVVNRTDSFGRTTPPQRKRPYNLYWRADDEGGTK